MPAQFLSRSELAGALPPQGLGAVVTVDTIRAFTTAAYAFAAGAREIYLVGTVEDALAFKREHPGALAMGEAGGQRPPGFDLSNSPVRAATADLAGRTIVQRTSAGTQGVLVARSARRQWCASLVTASATARALEASGLGAPVYVITGRGDRPDGMPADDGADDDATARFIESVRLGVGLSASDVIQAVRSSHAARFTRNLGPEHADPDDIDYATRIDAFDFAMEVSDTARGLRLTRT